MKKASSKNSLFFNGIVAADYIDWPECAKVGDDWMSVRTADVNRMLNHFYYVNLIACNSQLAADQC
jgi:hypothetical protein